MTDLVFILGAGRSGTNMLTFAFHAESSNFLNLGENRYVWSYGQSDRRSDRRRSGEATPKIVNYLQSHFEKRLRKLNGPSGAVLIDKTPSNSFRIPFIVSAFPDARFIHIIRDGRDNLLSRTRQWKAQKPHEAQLSVPMSGIAGKRRYISSRFDHLNLLLRSGSLPFDRLPIMVRDTLGAQLAHVLTGQPRHYGERVPGLREVLAVEGLDAAAAVQWREAVLRARIDGAELGSRQYHEIRYENFLAYPQVHWEALMRFLGRTPTGGGAKWLAENIVERNTQKWIDADEAQRIAALEQHLRPVLEHLGYSWVRDLREGQ